MFVSKKALAGLLTAAMVIGGGWGAAFGSAARDGLKSSVPPAVSSVPTTSLSITADPVSTVSGKGTVAEVAAKAADSVVEITTESVQTGFGMQQYISSGAGSGVILSSDGYLVTNNHVIDGASKILVTLRNGKSYSASLIGTDCKTDIAILKIEATGLIPAVLGNSDALVVGETAVAIGNPLGQLGGTVTDGIISAKARDIVLDGHTMSLLQTNAAINPGNSGGGLFNSSGQLIGLIVAKSSGEDIEGLGFAIPINSAKDIMDQMVNAGYVSGRIDLGMSLLNVSNAQTAMIYGVRWTGVYIQSVGASSNAAKAGLQAGDRIVAVDDKKVATMADLNSILDKHCVGDTVKFTVLRNNQAYVATFILQEYKK